MIFLLDQENVAHHGLSGIESLNENDFIVTFVGDNNRLPHKVESILQDSKIPFEIQNVSVGTKNAVDYQLVSYLTYLINKNKDKSFVVLSRDKGFETSINYLLQEHLNIEIVRCSSILEFQFRDFFKKDLNLSFRRSKQLYELLWSCRYSSRDKIEMKIKEQFSDISSYLLPSLDDFIIYIRGSKLKDSNDNEFFSEFSKFIMSVKTPSQTYLTLSELLGIDNIKYAKYLKMIRRCILRSKSFKDFEHKIMSNTELLDIGEVKRIDIPKKINLYYKVYKNVLAVRG